MNNGKKAFVHIGRIWITRQPIYGGFRCLHGPSQKRLNVNARSITPIHGVSHQVTFCHSGMNMRDFKKKEYLYPENMKSWIDRVVTLDSLNAELKQFTDNFRGWKWSKMIEIHDLLYVYIDFSVIFFNFSFL